MKDSGGGSSAIDLNKGLNWLIKSPPAGPPPLLAAMAIDESLVGGTGGTDGKGGGGGG